MLVGGYNVLTAEQSRPFYPYIPTVGVCSPRVHNDGCYVYKYHGTCCYKPVQGISRQILSTTYPAYYYWIIEGK